MNRWLRVFAPAVALAVVLVTAFAALGGGRASAGQVRVAGQPAVAQVAAQAAKPAAVAPQPAAVAAQPPVPTGEPKTGPHTDNVEQQDSAETPDNEAADAAVLASKAKITADQAKAAALVANPGATAPTTAPTQSADNVRPTPALPATAGSQATAIELLREL